MVEMVRDYKETVENCVRKDPAFATALLQRSFLRMSHQELPESLNTLIWLNSWRT